MNVGRILLVIAVLVLLYIVIRYFFSSTNTLTATIMPGTTQQQITADKLATNSSGANSSNFTYSIWFYIDDWNYRYNERKVLFGRMGSPTSSNTSGSVSDVGGVNPCPLVSFGAIENNLSIAITCAAPDADKKTNTTVHKCNISNVPIQTWTNLLISAYGRTLDIYMDGKLVNTCLLPGIAMINNSADVYVTPNGGFSGWTAKLQYFPNASNPETAWDIYKQGYGSSMFSSYNIKVTFSKNGVESNGFTI